MNTPLGEALRAIAKQVWNIDLQGDSDSDTFIARFVTATGVTEPAATELLETLSDLSCT